MARRTAKGEQALKALLAGEAAGEDAEEERKALERRVARLLWLRGHRRALLAANKACDAAWGKLIDAHPEIDFDDPDAPQLDPPPEQAEADRLFAQIEAILAHDRWPRHLHWRDV